MSRASFRRKGPRSGLSRDGSGLGESGGGFLGENLEREGDGDGGFLGSGVAGLEDGVAVSGRGVSIWELSGREIRGGSVSGGVLTDTRPGMLMSAAAAVTGRNQGIFRLGNQDN